MPEYGSKKGLTEAGRIGKKAVSKILKARRAVGKVTQTNWPTIPIPKTDLIISVPTRIPTKPLRKLAQKFGVGSKIKSGALKVARKTGLLSTKPPPKGGKAAGGYTGKKEPVRPAPSRGRRRRGIV
jgi:hypothetical protein